MEGAHSSNTLSVDDHQTFVGVVIPDQLLYM